MDVILSDPNIETEILRIRDLEWIKSTPILDKTYSWLSVAIFKEPEMIIIKSSWPLTKDQLKRLGDTVLKYNKNTFELIIPSNAYSIQVVP